MVPVSYSIPSVLLYPNKGNNHSRLPLIYSATLRKSLHRFLISTSGGAESAGSQCRRFFDFLDRTEMVSAVRLTGILRLDRTKPAFMVRSNGEMSLDRTDSSYLVRSTGMKL